MNHILPEGHHTDRLTFSRITQDIKAEWLPFFEDPDSTRYLGIDKGYPEEQCQHWIDKQLQRYEEGNGLSVLRKTEDGAMIGMCGALFQVVDGKQVTEFKDGILPWAYQNNVALVFDEYDAGRPDVMFVIQRVLESSGRLT